MKISLFLVCLLMSLVAQSQPDSLFGSRKWVIGEYADFTVDNLNNIYLFSPTGQLKKLNSNGDSMAVFNDVRRYGKIYSIDVSNPLKVLLYFKDFGTVVVLDRFLSRRNVIDLRRLGLFQVKAIGQAYDNGYWVFDEQEGKLKRLDDGGQLVDQFTDFRVLFDTMPSPQYIVDQNKNLYLYDTARGVFVFDYYGAFRKRLPFIGWKDFAVINNFLFGRSDSKLFRYDPVTLQLREFPIDKSMRGATKIQITPDNLYILRPDRLEIFPFKR